MGAVADAHAVRPDAQNSDGGGLIAERSKSTIVALANALMTPLQMFFLIVFGVASAVFLISLWIIHRRDTVLVEYQVEHEQPDGLSVHEDKMGWTTLRRGGDYLLQGDPKAGP
jgi:hypothetical protein